MTIYLRVPFAEKDRAKALGAKWDYGMRAWYAPTPEVRESCNRWPELTSAAPKRATSTRPNVILSRPIVGSQYFRINCDCLPWEPCHACRRVVDAVAWQGSHMDFLKETA
jgi:hypothetical protein